MNDTINTPDRKPGKHYPVAYSLVWICVFFVFLGLYLTARNAVINEVRSHAMGVAIATAAGIDPSDLERVKEPGDAASQPFLRVQELLSTISERNPDVRYVYTMRRSNKPGAGLSDYEYIVDEKPRDDDGNGIIGPDEISEPPGKIYDASDYPEMILAWEHPAADRRITPDPPYPDMLSGYAPVKNASGQTVAIVGVDIIARTIQQKLLILRVSIVLAALLCAVLTSQVVHLNHEQRRALKINQQLNRELAQRNRMLKDANAELVEHNERFEEEMRLAQTVQMGFLPKRFPHRDHIDFAKCCETCSVLGGDQYDVFEIGKDCVGLYIADVAGHGVRAALISGLLKMAISSMQMPAGDEVEPVNEKLLAPDRLLSLLNDAMLKEIPERDYMTLLYALFRLRDNTVTISNAGHPNPLFYNAESDTLDYWVLKSGGAVGLISSVEYTTVTRNVARGDKMIFYTDGLTEAMNGQGEELGQKRFKETVLGVIRQSPAEIVDAVRHAVEGHRDGEDVSDDFTLLVLEFKK